MKRLDTRFGRGIRNTTRRRVCMIGMALCLVAGSSSRLAAQDDLRLVKLDSYAPGVPTLERAEINAFDPETQRIFVTNLNDITLDVIDASDPNNTIFDFQIDLSSYGGVPNSVAIHGDVVAVALESFVKTDNGAILFFDTDGNFITQLIVGAQPDMLTFTRDGQHLLVVNEGEPNDDYSVDPNGSVSIIDMSGPIRRVTQARVRTVSFTGYNTSPLPENVRVFGPNATPAQDFEPEYIAVATDGRTAYVTLQENNAIAVIDIRTATISSLFGLGFKDHSLTRNRFDASDRDNAINIASWPVYGMYLPDAIATYRHNGTEMLVMANEGDSRVWGSYNEETRVSSLTLDATIFPDAATLKAPANIGRLVVTKTLGDTDDDGDYDALYAFGARSFSIRSSDGTLIFDSGDEFERLIAAALPTDFNANNETNSSFDNRSDNKGPEPEGLAIGEIKGRTYAFIGFERVGGIVTYDITDPTAPVIVDYINSRIFSGDVELGTAGDVGPEGLHFVAKQHSPTGKPLLIVSHEISGSTTIYEITQTSSHGTKGVAAMGEETPATALGSAVPNPTSSSTEVAFSLDADCVVRLDVIDGRGVVVKTVRNERVNGGTHTVEIELSDLPVGAYFARLMVEGNVIGLRPVRVVR